MERSVLSGAADVQNKTIEYEQNTDLHVVTSLFRFTYNDLLIQIYKYRLTF